MAAPPRQCSGLRPNRADAGPPSALRPSLRPALSAASRRSFELSAATAPRRRAAQRGDCQVAVQGTPGALSLDHLIRPLQERRRNRQAEGLGGLEVDDQLDLRRLLYR